jgi:hypothetical protein
MNGIDTLTAERHIIHPTTSLKHLEYEADPNGGLQTYVMWAQVGVKYIQN